MPTYEFQCEKCTMIFEDFLSMSAMDVEMDVAVTECPKCSAKITRGNQLMNFGGAFNMNSSFIGKAKRKYANHQGGPTAIIGGKDTGKRANWT